MSSTHKVNCGLLAVLFCFLCSPTYSQTPQYGITLTRGMGTNINQCTLICADISVLDDSEERNYLFWINSTSNELGDVLARVITVTNGIVFTIDRMTEGEFFCGPDRNTLSNRISLVAYPTRNQTLEQIGSVTVRFQAGTTAVLDPFVPPGIWHSYYYIDWVDASTGRTVSRVAGPRSIAASQLTLDERYSVDSNNFSFLIESVSRSDAGSYRGVLGLRDPEGANEVYVQTRELNITLFVYEAPSITRQPLDQVVSLQDETEVQFTCSAVGYPSPKINWYHNNNDITLMPDKYRIDLVEDESSSMSSLTVLNLHMEDSGFVSCVASVEPGDDISSLTVSETAQLSVLGNIPYALTHITTTGNIIFTVYLSAELPAEVYLRFYYREDFENNAISQTHNATTPTPYSGLKVLTYLEPNVPFQQFKVDISIVHGALESPMYQGLSQSVQDTSIPTCNCTPLYMLLVTILIPCLAVIFLVIIIAPLVTCCVAKWNKRRFIELLLKNASEEDRKVVAGRELIKLGLLPPSSGQGGPPNPILTQRRFNFKREPDYEAIRIVDDILVTCNKATDNDYIEMSTK